MPRTSRDGLIMDGARTVRLDPSAGVQVSAVIVEARSRGTVVYKDAGEINSKILGAVLVIYSSYNTRTKTDLHNCDKCAKGAEEKLLA